MSDELKSAWELAQEKLRARGAGESRSLTERQKLAISEIRETFSRRRAEARVLYEQALRRALEKGERERAALLREEHEREMARLDEDEEKRVDEVRSRTDR